MEEYFMKRTVNPLLALDELIPDVEARIFTGSDHKERLFLYGSRDLYDQGTWCSHQYRVYSAPLTNLADWTDHGVSFASRKGEGYFWDDEEADGVSWNDAILYAPDVIDKDGKYWLASCFSGGGLGMSVSDVPEGPFSPAERIVYDDGLELGSIDPTLYVEDDRFYLIWGQRQTFGGEGLVGVELSQNQNGMYSIAKRSSKKYLFGDRDNPDQGFGFYEGASIRKIQNRYYILYPSDKGQGIHMMSYATANHPLGPYTYQGNILDNDGCDLQPGNNHGSICEVNGTWYIFYHRGFGNSNMRRRVCVEALQMDEDGKIKIATMTNHGFEGPLSPYERIEASYVTHVRINGYPASCFIDKVERGKDRIYPLVQIKDGNCVEYKDFHFGEAVGEMSIHMELKPLNVGKIKVRLDDPEGPEIGLLRIFPEMGQEWIFMEEEILDITGIHTIYFEFESEQNEGFCEIAAFWFLKK